MPKQKRAYHKLWCERLQVEPVNMVLADSIFFNGKISSVGQDVGFDETFIESDYINGQWETDF